MAADPARLPRVGLDIGGTTIKGGVIDAALGDELAADAVAFDPEAPSGEIWRRSADLVRTLEARSGARFDRIGVGCAGLFDRDSGVVLASANMPNLVGHSLTDGIAAALGGGPRVILENDANVAAFGEQWFGAGRDVTDMVFLTLGTGVGGGVILDNRIFLGPRGNAGEIGHIVVHPRPGGSEYDAPHRPELECACGSYGCVEKLISATSAKRRAAARGLSTDLEELCDRARRSAGPERDLLRQIGRDLGSALATLVTLFDVGTFVIGGGFGAALDLMEAGAREVLEDRRYGTDPVQVLPAALGNDAGWIGAARLGC